MNPVHRLKINHKLLLLVFLVSLVSTCAYSIRSYQQRRVDIMEGIDSKLLAGALGVDLLVGKEYHDRISGPRSIPRPEYLRNLNRLTEVANRTGFEYLYSLMEFDSKIVFTATNATPQELKTRTWDWFFRHYDDASAALVLAFKDRKTHYEAYQDKYGSHRSVFVPRRTSAGKVYVLAADVPISFIQARLWQSLLDSVLIGLGIFLVIFCCAYLLVNMISKPIKNLADYTREMASRDFAPSAEVDSAMEKISNTYKDEVGNLAGSFLFMEHELHNYIQEVKDTTAAKERIESELRVAREIQMGVLPQEFPPFPHRKEFDVHASIEPAKEMSGDFYDFYLIDDDHFYFTIGDVSGKGVPSSLLMVSTRTLLEASAHDHDEPNKILDRVNTEICRKNESMMFVTVFYCILDVRSGELHYANAGHNLPYLIRRDGTVEFLGELGEPAMGVIEDFEYKCKTVTLEPGDCLFLYTDGVTEAMSLEGQEFSEPRLEELLRAAPDSPVPEMIDAVVAEVKKFATGAPQSDDITTVAVRYWGTPEPPPASGQVATAEASLS